MGQRIADMIGGQRRIIAFNDGDAGYEDVDLVLRRARDRAQAAAHGVPFRLVLETVSREGGHAMTRGG